jgi:nucleoside 2-deoxyribosyltransferase
VIQVPDIHSVAEFSKRMLNAYIAAPFSSRTNDISGRAYGEIVDFELVSLLESMEEVLRSSGYSVCLPHRDEGAWGKRYIDPTAIAALCCNLITRSDLVIGLPQQSRGVHFEIGWAAALGKRVILLVHEEEDTSVFLYGLPALGDITVRRYRDKSGLLFQLELAIREILQNYNSRVNPPLQQTLCIHAKAEVEQSPKS